MTTPLTPSCTPRLRCLRQSRAVPWGFVICFQKRVGHATNIEQEVSDDRPHTTGSKISIPPLALVQRVTVRDRESEKDTVKSFERGGVRQEAGTFMPIASRGERKRSSKCQARNLSCNATLTLLPLTSLPFMSARLVLSLTYGCLLSSRKLTHMPPRQYQRPSAPGLPASYADPSPRLCLCPTSLSCCWTQTSTASLPWLLGRKFGYFEERSVRSSEGGGRGNPSDVFRLARPLRDIGYREHVKSNGCLLYRLIRLRSSKVANERVYSAGRENTITAPLKSESGHRSITTRNRFVLDSATHRGR